MMITAQGADNFTRSGRSSGQELIDRPLQTPLIPPDIIPYAVWLYISRHLESSGYRGSAGGNRHVKEPLWIQR